MTNKKGRTESAQPQENTQTNSTVNLGWRFNLTAIPGFKMNGFYDEPATGRRLRRILARKNAKVAK